MSPDVVLVRTGVANVASVTAALQRLGVEPRLSDDPAVIRGAAAVVLPGVGAFGAGMERLDAAGLVTPLRARVERGEPTLAVCLGLQLLGLESEEEPGVPGLGVAPTRTRRLTGAPRLPPVGWNQVEPDPGCTMLTAGEAYFAHSFRLDDSPALAAEGWSVARSLEGEPFVAAIERGAVLGCQFHPELSGTYGAALLERWLERAALTLSGGAA